MNAIMLISRNYMNWILVEEYCGILRYGNFFIIFLLNSIEACPCLPCGSKVLKSTQNQLGMFIYILMGTWASVLLEYCINQLSWLHTHTRTHARTHALFLCSIMFQYCLMIPCLPSPSLPPLQSCLLYTFFYICFSLPMEHRRGHW